MRIFKNGIVIALVVFFVVHISFTILYSLPENLIAGSIKEKSKSYMDPLFSQGWALFAPVPEVNKKVFVSYLKEDGEWSRWDAPFEKYKQRYQSNRMSSAAKIVLSMNMVLHYLYEENKSQLEIKQNFPGNKSSGLCKVLKYEAQQELASRDIVSEKIKLLVVFKPADCEAAKTYSVYFPE